MNSQNKNIADDLCKELNSLLGYPADMFTEHALQGNRMNVNHIYVDSNYAGHQLEQIVSELGAARNITNRMPAKEMVIFLKGMISGVENFKHSRQVHNVFSR